MSEQTVEERALENRCKAEWDSDANLRAEFAGRFETYLAYRKDIPGVKVRENSGQGCTKEAFNPANF